MKRAVWFLSAAVAMVVLAGGCASTAGDGADKPRPEEMSGMGHEEAEKLAADYIAGFVASLKENDFDKLKAVIPADSKTETMGNLVDARFVTDLDKSIVRDYVWKFSFEKTLTDGPAKGRKVRHELFYMVRVGRLDGKYVIAGTGFRL